MNLRGIASLGRRRRLVDLRTRPGLQLKLPVLVLAITAGFCGLFLAHTRAAYGPILEFGLDDLWQHALGREIGHDYFVVSVSIAIAYAVFVVGVCLAATHRFLGPIVALRRQFDDLKRGDYTPRVRLRAGHPLSGIADDLNELSEMLQRANPKLSIDRRVAANQPVADQRANALDRIVSAYARERGGEKGGEPSLASAAV